MKSHNDSSADICDAAVDRAMTSFQQAVNSMVSCKRCNGTGYHHGFGEHGHDPDWCEVCGGCQSVPEFNDREAMCLAIKAALSGAVAQGSPERERIAELEEALEDSNSLFTAMLLEKRSSFEIETQCYHNREVLNAKLPPASQPPAAPVETERKTFTIPPGYEAVRDSEGRATGEVRPHSSAETVEQAIACIPVDLNWLIGKGKTRPDEPPFGVQLLRGLKIIAETEGDDLCETIKAAIKIVEKST